MPPSRSRIVWPILCGVLVAALAGSILDGRKKLRAATRQLAKATQLAIKARAKTGLDKRDTAYFDALAKIHGYTAEPPLKTGDMARLAAYDRLELNKLAAIAGGGDPITFPARDLEFSQRTTFAVAPTMQAPLPSPFTHYRYALRNKSDRILPAPILFQNDRWDSAEALVSQAGFKSIENEVERAIAIWKYVSAHRVFGDPPTQGREEHDVLKFLAVYGYGYCDDTARAVATLAELSGLRGRIWNLEGHLVSEVFAGGHWRMLDADQQAYLHRAGAPREILGVEELSADRATFDHVVSLRGENGYSPQLLEHFLTRENNQLDDRGTSAHRLQPILRPGESLTLTNYNWGRYFLGKFPASPPRFYNGFFSCTFDPGHLAAGAGRVVAETIEGGHRLSNPGSDAATATLEVAYPFPIVGGSIIGTPEVKSGAVELRLEDPAHDRVLHLNPAHGLKISLDHFISVLASEPTYRCVLTFTLHPGAVLELRDFIITSDIQFAPLALLKLQPGANEIHAHLPEGTDATAFEVIVETK